MEHRRKRKLDEESDGGEGEEDVISSAVLKELKRHFTPNSDHYKALERIKMLEGQVKLLMSGGGGAKVCRNDDKKTVTCTLSSLLSAKGRAKFETNLEEPSERYRKKAMEASEEVLKKALTFARALSNSVSTNKLVCDQLKDLLKGTPYYEILQYEKLETIMTSHTGRRCLKDYLEKALHQLLSSDNE